MSTTNKTLIGIVGIVVILLIAFFALRAHAPSESAAVNDDSSLPTSPNDTSDAALQKDATAIDTQLSGLDSDSATVDQGISETQQ